MTNTHHLIKKEEVFVMKYLLMILILLPGVIRAEVIHVPADQPTIQAGINVAVNGDIVLVVDGIYYENISFKGKAITVASYYIIDRDTNHINNTVVSGSQPSNPDSGSVVFFNSGEDTTSILCVFTITGGTGSITPDGVIHGGGINLFQSGGKIIHNKIVHNKLSGSGPGSMGIGGGISQGPPGNVHWTIIEYNFICYNSVTGIDFGGGGGICIVGNTRISDNIIEFNSIQTNSDAAWGGGIYCFNMDVFLNLTRRILRNTIRYNKAFAPTSSQYEGGVGGGLAIIRRSAEIKDNIITYNEIKGSNTTKSYGAGLFLHDQDTTSVFSNNLISYNSCVNITTCRGAGISIWSYNFPCNPRLMNNIISHNSGGTYGGGLYIGGWQPNFPLIENNTIAYNPARIAGGAVFSEGAFAQIKNSILWGNTSSNNTQIHLLSDTIYVAYSDIEGGWPGEGNIDANPMFLNPESLWFCLDDQSPCIDAGDPANLDPEDPFNPGYALWPAQGTTLTDMGAFGGSYACVWNPAITGLEKKKSEFNLIAERFQLSQNYPNPFNPTTTISFSLPKTSHIILKIFNILGEEVATLVSQRLPAGNYEYQWSRPAGIASGVYLYRIQAENYGEVKKMLFIK
jgi:hypothetical protein